MRSFLLSLDIYGAKPSLFVGGKTEYKTLLGTITTIFTILFSVGACIMFGQDFFFKLNPSVVTEEKIEEEPLVIYPTTDTFTVFFEVVTGNGKPLNPANLKTKFLTSFTYLKKNSNNDYEVILSDLSDPKLCSETNATNNTNLESVNLENAYCLDWEDLSAQLGKPVPLGGFLGDNELSLFRIEVRNLSASGESSPFSEIKHELVEGIALKVSYPSFIFDVNSLNNPIKTRYDSFVYNLKPNVERIDRHFFEAATLEDDIGWIFEDIKTYKAFKKDNYQTDMNIIMYSPENNEKVDFYNFLGYLSKKNNIFKRKYMKIQEVAALAGGFIKILHLSCSVFMDMYSNFCMGNCLIAHEGSYKEVKLNAIDFKRSISISKSDGNLRLQEEKSKKKENNLSFMSYLLGRLRLGKNQKYCRFVDKLKKTNSKLDILFLNHFFPSLQEYISKNLSRNSEQASELKKIFNPKVK